MRDAPASMVPQPLLVKVFLGLACAACFLFCMQFGTVAAPMAATDEAPAASYAAALAGGTLPTIDTPMSRDPDSFPGYYLQHRRYADAAHGAIWVANHPPLFYALGVPIVWIADATHTPAFAALALRALNAAGTAALVLLAGLLAGALLPGRPSAVPLAAAVAAAMTTLTFDGGGIYNDGMAAAFGAWGLLLVIRMLRFGPTGRRLVVLTVACTAAAATRASSLPVVAFGVVGVAVAVWLHDREPGWQRRALYPALLVGGVPVLAVGWFYVRNWALYGSPTASQVLVDRFGRVERPQLLTPSGAAQYLSVQWQRLFVQRRMGEAVDDWNEWIRVVGVVVAVGLLVGGVVGIVRWAVAGRSRFSGPAAVGLAVGWATVLVHAAVTIVAMLSFLATGGGSHERYFMPMTPTLSVVVAAGLLGLVAWWPGSRGHAEAVVSAVGVAYFLLFAVLLQWQTAAWSESRADNRRAGGPLGGPVVPDVVGVLGSIAAGLALAVLMWHLAGQWRRPEPVSAAVAEPADQEHPVPAGSGPVGRETPTSSDADVTRDPATC